MMHRTSSRVLLIVAAFVLLLVPVAAIAAGGFTDVEDGSVFKADIQWLADAGVTRGCNPPTNDKFCPGSNVTREQMAAFMHRLAVNRVVDAKTAVTAADADKLDGMDSTAFLGKTQKAADSDKLDGKDSAAFAGSGHDHDSAYVAKDEFDSDSDGIVDAAEVKIRHTIADNNIDVADPYTYVCQTAPLTLDTQVTVVGSGSLSLLAWAAHTGNDPFGYIVASDDGGTTWEGFGLGFASAFPPATEQYMSIPMDGVDTLPAGTYTFAVRIWALENLQAGNDYYYLCGLTIQAYTGQGAATDVVVVNNT